MLKFLLQGISNGFRLCPFQGRLQVGFDSVFLGPASHTASQAVHTVDCKAGKITAASSKFGFVVAAQSSCASGLELNCKANCAGSDSLETFKNYTLQEVFDPFAYRLRGKVPGKGRCYWISTKW